MQTYPLLGESLYRTTLPNGLTVLVQPRPGFTRKIAYFVTDFGAIHTRFSLDGREYRVPEGVAHFLEHKLFDMPGRDITEEFSALGAVPNAFTGYDLTAYYFSCTEHFEQALQLLLEFVSTPYFTDESVQKEQGIIGQEIDMVADSPDSRIFELLMQAMYRNHPVRFPILGTRQSIARITPQILQLCHRAFYRPDNMLLCVVGDVDPQLVCSLASRLSPPPREQVTLPRQWPEALTCPESLTQTTMEVAMTTFQLGFKCQPEDRGEPAVRQEYVADLAAELLFGESSPLYLRLYEEGLIDSSFGGGFETIEGMAMLTAAGDSRDPETVTQAILDQAALLLQQGITQEQLLRATRSALGRRIRGLDSFDSTAFRLCAYHMSGYDYFRFPEIYQQITPGLLLDFLAQTVTRAHMSLCIINPIEQEETL